MSAEADAPPVYRADGALTTELHPTAGVVYLTNAEGDTVRLEGDEVRRAAGLLIAAHVERGRYASEARAAAQPSKARK